ncbi:TniQ family protein [Roseateles paludis]|uniref:TniQ family protein n=1 Tax=Roseateles paludis TaxID=3145238 RepID=A0ABV0FVT1_9BURK
MSADLGRSMLWPLRPIGVGTADAESAQSYAWRLANSHGVAPLTLHKFINGHGAEIYKDLRGQPPRLDAPTAEASMYMQRLATLTRQPEVALLGLGWLAGRFSGQYLLRRQRAWCAGCFRYMEASGMPLHEPLRWAFLLGAYCPRHGSLLCDRCPACGRMKSCSRVQADSVTRCDSCGVYLLQIPAGAYAGGVDGQRMSSGERAIQDQLGELICFATPAALGRKPLSFARLIAELHRRGHPVSPTELTRRLGVVKSTVSSLMRGHSQPSLDFMLRLATALRVPLPDLLFERSGRDLDYLVARPGWSAITWPARTKPRIDWQSAQGALDMELQATVALPVSQVARRLNIDARHLAVAEPLRAAAIRRRYRAEARTPSSAQLNC